LNEEARALLAQLQALYEQTCDVLGEDTAKNVWARSMIGTERRSLAQAVLNTQTMLQAASRRQRTLASKKARKEALTVQFASPSSSKAVRFDSDKLVTIPGIPSSAVLPEGPCEFNVSQTSGFGRVLRVRGPTKGDVDAAVKGIRAPKWWAMMKLQVATINSSNWEDVIPRKFVYRVISQQPLSDEQVGEALFTNFKLRTSWIQKQSDTMFVVVIPFPESVLAVIGQNKGGIGIAHYDMVKAAETAAKTTVEAVTMSIVSPSSPRLAWISSDESAERKATKSFYLKQATAFSTVHAEMHLGLEKSKHVSFGNKGIGKRETWR